MEKGNGHSGVDEIKQRALKITEALYRTTDVMFDGEPLKWSLRETGVDILNIVSNLNSGSQLRDIEKLNGLIKNLFLKLELASSGTFISKVNFEVLQREYSILGDYAMKQEQPILLEYRTKEITDTVSDKSILDKAEMSEEQAVVEEKKIEEKRIEPDPNRKTVIISALESKGHSSISDIASLFNGTIGEKTVQRELNALVEVGVIKKEGEKRWRRYFL